ncbi:hypothetical protein ACQ4PT_032533 [Festuca glaucescens]
MDDDGEGGGLSDVGSDAHGIGGVLHVVGRPWHARGSSMDQPEVVLQGSVAAFPRWLASAAYFARMWASTAGFPCCWASMVAFTSNCRRHWAVLMALTCWKSAASRPWCWTSKTTSLRYIAVEFASIWRGLGAEVDLFYRKEFPLRKLCLVASQLSPITNMYLVLFSGLYGTAGAEKLKKGARGFC